MGDSGPEPSDPTAGINIAPDAHVRDITVHGDVAGRDIVNITEELTYDVSDLSQNPYLGLASFTYATRAFYGGREQQVAESVERLTGPGDEPVVLFVTGASGSGKSSFVQAGLVPALEAAYAVHGRTVRWAVLRPGRHPIEALERAVQGWCVPDAQTLLRAPEDLNQLLATCTARTQVNVLVLDQFEELFTQAEPIERDTVSALLAGLDSFAHVRTHVIATLRADYLPALFESPALLDRFKRDGVELRAMSTDELARAIRRPLQEQARLENKVKRLDPGLVDRLVEDVCGDPALLPLLQVTLRALWDEPPHTLVLDRYRSLTHALQQQANRLLDQDRQGRQRSTAEREQLMGIFLDLVEVSLDDDPRRDVRRTLPKQEVVEGQPERSKLIDELADARLLTTSMEQQRDATVEVVDIIHESLLENWPHLREAITAHREALQRRERFRLALREWLHNERNPAYLLQGVRLAEARSLVEQNDIAVREPAARDLVRQSIDREQREQRRAARTRLAVVLTLLAIVSTAGVVSFAQRQDALAGWASADAQRAIADAERGRAEVQAGIALEQARLASERERAARARELAAQSNAVLRQLPQRSLLLAIEAVRSMREAGLEIPSAVDALRQAVVATGGSTIGTGPGTVAASAISSNGRWLAVGFEDGFVWLVDVASTESARTVHKLRGYGEPVSEVAFTAADKRLVVTDRHLSTRDERDRLLRLYTVPASGAAPALVSADNEVFSSLSISPDRRWVATVGGRAPGIRLWDLSAPQVAPTDLLEAPAALESLERNNANGPVFRFSPNGRWLVAVGKDDHAARLWDLNRADPMPPTLLTGVNASVVEHQGRMYVVTRPTPQRALVWDLSEPNPLAGPSQVPDPLTDVDKMRLSPDRRWLVAGFAYDVLLWDLSSEQPPVSLAELGTSAEQLDISLDGRWLWVVLGNQIGFGRLASWDLTQPIPPQTKADLGIVRGQFQRRADGLMVAVSDGRGLYRAWRMDRPGPTSYAVANEASDTDSPVNDVLLFLDNNRGLLTVHGAAIRVWPNPTFPSTEAPLATLRGHEGPISAASISTDGRWLATVGTDRTIRIWDLQRALDDAGTAGVAQADDLALMEMGCARAGRNLSSAEWREIFGEEQYRATCSALPPGA